MNTRRNLLLVAGLLLAMTSQAQQNDRIPAKGFAFHAEDGHFHDYSFTRRAVGDNDVQIKRLARSRRHKGKKRCTRCFGT